MSDKFQELINNNYAGFQTESAKRTIDESIYATKFLEKNLDKLNEYKDFFDDDYMDKALKRAHLNGNYNKYMQSWNEGFAENKEDNNEYYKNEIGQMDDTDEYINQSPEILSENNNIERIEELK